MSSFDYKGITVQYKVIGTGRPMLVLNGILMSMASWSAFEGTFSANNQLILLDMADQGLTSRMTESYTQQFQVEIVEALLVHLSLDQVSIMGISYGGEVALQYVLAYPHRVDKLVLANTASRTSIWLRDIGYSWNEVGAQANGLAYYFTTIPVIYSTEFYQDNQSWFDNRKIVLSELFESPQVMATYKRLVDSAEHYNVTDKLSQIKSPTLIISGTEDLLTPIAEQRILHQGIANSSWVTMAGSGHASMYEQPHLFASLVLGWVNTIIIPTII